MLTSAGAWCFSFCLLTLALIKFLMITKHHYNNIDTCCNHWHSGFSISSICLGSSSSVLMQQKVTRWRADSEEDSSTWHAQRIMLFWLVELIFQVVLFWLSLDLISLISSSLFSDCKDFLQKPCLHNKDHVAIYSHIDFNISVPLPMSQESGEERKGYEEVGGRRARRRMGEE